METVLLNNCWNTVVCCFWRFEHYYLTLLRAHPLTLWSRFKSCHACNWAGTGQNLQADLCTRWRLRSACLHICVVWSVIAGCSLGSQCPKCLSCRQWGQVCRLIRVFAVHFIGFAGCQLHSSWPHYHPSVWLDRTTDKF